MSQFNKTLLLIMDGWGIADDPAVSAVDQAHTPFYDQALQQYAHARLDASGQAVGLPEGQMGNSEVGHMNLGAGRIVYQELVRVQKALDEGTFQQQPAFQQLVNYCTEHQKPLHLMGLLSDGGVHSSLAHLQGILRVLGQTAIPAVYIHCFMDGRDTSPTGGIEYVRTLQAHCREAGAGQIATLIGRYYAMDRDQRWERIKKAYDLLVHGKGTPYESPAEALSVSYKAGLTDEFIEPTVITEGGAPVAQIEEEDAVLFFNFRTDRGRELTTVLTQEARPAYDMQPLPLHYTTLTEYDRTFEGVNVLFQPQSLNDTMGEVLAREGASQLRIAETEKYAHVTFFFNGGQETQYEGESRELIPSPKVATYDQQPAMSAEEVRQRVRDYIQGVHGPAPDFICLNYANPDMVGHTGDMTAAIQACETVDRCVADTVAAARAAGYTTLILADHGNADRMRKPDGSPHTAHTTALVPMIAIPPDDQTQLMVRGGKLGDVAPTLLSLMGIEVPAAMTGEIIVRQLEASMR